MAKQELGLDLDPGCVSKVTAKRVGTALLRCSGPPSHQPTCFLSACLLSLLFTMSLFSFVFFLLSLVYFVRVDAFTLSQCHAMCGRVVTAGNVEYCQSGCTAMYTDCANAKAATSIPQCCMTYCAKYSSQFDHEALCNLSCQGANNLS